LPVFSNSNRLLAERIFRQIPAVDFRRRPMLINFSLPSASLLPPLFGPRFSLDGCPLANFFRRRIDYFRLSACLEHRNTVIQNNEPQPL